MDREGKGLAARDHAHTHNAAPLASPMYRSCDLVDVEPLPEPREGSDDTPANPAS